MENLKLCRNCSTAKHVSNFNKSSKTKSGLQNKCRECEKAYKNKNKEHVAKMSKEYYANNKDKCQALTKSWYERNKEKGSQYHKTYYINNKERHQESTKRWASENRDAYERARKNWRENNPERVKEINNRANKTRNRRLSLALPKWASLEAIEAIYATAKAMRDTDGLPVEVDHIIPISSSKVCGLHVESNLRIISRESNSKKGNRVWPDMP